MNICTSIESQTIKTIKNMKRLFTLLAMLLMMPLLGLAQEMLELPGKVYMLNYVPLPNMKVTSMKTGESVMTDANGEFKIKTMDKDQLLIEGEPFNKLRHRVKVSKKNTLEVPDLMMTFNADKDNLTKIIKNGHLAQDYLEQTCDNFYITKNWTKYVDIWQAIKYEFPSITVRDGDLIYRDHKLAIFVDGIEVSSPDQEGILDIADMHIMQPNECATYNVTDGFCIKTKRSFEIMDPDDFKGLYE